MDKPVTLSVKNWIIRKMSVDMKIQERVIETVVNHQFDSAYEALRTKNSLEFSGWGKFLFNEKKAEKKLAKLKEIKEALQRRTEDEEETPLKRKNAEIKLAEVTKDYEQLKKKLDEA